jgi:hypothetical protein
MTSVVSGHEQRFISGAFKDLEKRD